MSATGPKISRAKVLLWFQQRGVAYIFLCLPLAISLTVSFSPFEWAWYRTEYAVLGSWLMTGLSWGIMALGLRRLNPAANAIVMRDKYITLAGILVVLQLLGFGLGIFSVVQQRVALDHDRHAYSVGQGAFGGTWTNTWISQRQWLLLRREYLVEQYDKGGVIGLSATADGGLDVLKSEFGREKFVSHYSAAQLEATRRKYWRIEP